MTFRCVSSWFVQLETIAATRNALEQWFQREIAGGNAGIRVTAEARKLIVKTWHFALLGMILPALAGGCRTDPAVPILERQLRLQEDEIYRLRATVEELQDGADCRDRDSRSAAEAGRRGSSRSSTDSNGSSDSPPLDITVPSTPSSEGAKALKGADKPAPLWTPESSRKPPIAPGSKSSRADGPSLDPPARGAATGTTSATGDSRRVASIAMNRAMSGGINSGNPSGDRGLLVVVEPRDRAGRTIDAPADMSVLVLDPAVLDNQGKAARVGRWDFSAAETASLFRGGDSSRAVHLAMAWPADPPRHRKLHAFIRYTTADGRRLETDGPIEAALPGDRQAGWTPAPPRVRDDRDDRDSGESRTAESSSGESWRHNGVSPEPPAELPPQMATRTDPQRLERPVWSPERR